jgi:hypothetical protein
MAREIRKRQSREGRLLSPVEKKHEGGRWEVRAQSGSTRRSCRVMRVRVASFE